MRLRGLAISGAALAGVAVLAGAFAAHGLEDRLTPEMLEIFRTGAHYHMIHALAILLVAWPDHGPSAGRRRVAGWLHVAGITIFSGSLYALALTEARWLGAITPIGGSAFIAGWIACAFAALAIERR